MRPEQKKYILENVGKRSIKEIAASLGIEERSVRKYLEARGIKGTGVEKPATLKEEKTFTVPLAGKAGRALPVIAIIILIFAAYSGALGNGFIWDDEFLIRDNTAIKSFANIPSVFKTYLAATSGNVNTFYRPVQELSYMADYRIWGDNPFGYHFTNVTLHAACAVMLYFLSLRILGNAFAAFVTALLFGIHPVNTEAVTYVAGRADSLYLLFFLVSFGLFLKSQDALRDNGRLNMNCYALSLLSYASALLSKEMALVMPLFLLAYILVFVPRSAVRTKLCALCAPFGGIALLYMIARKTVLDFSASAPAFSMAKYNLGIRLLTTCKAITVYLSLLIAPFNLHMERAVAKISLVFNAATFTALSVTAALFIITWYFYRRSKRLFFASIWFFLGILPVSNIIPINSFIAEHWLYLPAIGIFMIAGTVCGNLFYGDKGTRRTGAVSIVMIASLFFGILTFERNKDWKDGITFFKNTLKYSPRNTRLHLNFGNVYERLGRLDDAIAEYRKAVETDPNYTEALYNLGCTYLKKGDYHQAKIYFRKALALKPKFPIAPEVLEIMKSEQLPE